jgi:hypothetical protein
MFPDIDPGAGGIDHALSDGDISGGQHVVNVSTEAIDCPPPLPPMIPLGPCLNSTDDLLRKPDFAVISPNPNNGKFAVTVKNAIISTTGQVVLELNEVEASTYTLTKDLPSGIYFVKGILRDGTYFLNKITISK